MDFRGSLSGVAGVRRAAAALVLALAFAWALGAVSASASELPAIGQCVRVALAKQPKTGRFKDKKCTKPSTGENTGAFEFRSMPAAEARFSQSPSPYQLAARGTVDEVICEAVQGEGRTPVIEGEFTGAQSMLIKFRFHSCHAVTKAGAYACGQERSTAVLEGTLGFIDGKIAKPTVGWELKPALGGALLELECLTLGPVALNGSLIAEVTPVGKAADYDTFWFAKEKKHLIPEALEGMGPAALEIAAEGASEPATPSGHAQTFSLYGPLIKALP